jgi:hypothetical protein
MTTTTTLEQELLDLERRYWKAMAIKDTRTLADDVRLQGLVGHPHLETAAGRSRAIEGVDVARLE